MRQSIDKSIIQQAAAWLVRIREKPLNKNEQQSLHEWKMQSDAHQQAWMKAEAFTRQFETIPSNIAMHVLDRPERLDRRQAIKSLGMAAMAVPAGVLAYEMLPWQYWASDISTSKAGMRTVQLQDGGVITLNIASAVDLVYTDNTRLIKLYEGDIYIETAKDSLNRPFLVETPHGRLRALGTKFFVSKREHESYLGVLEGAVEVSLADSGQPPQVVSAGQQVWFKSATMASATQLDGLNTGWLDGVLYADNTPLKDVIATLSRYRAGVLRCDPSAANISVSGAFQLNNPDHVLEVLQQSRPIHIAWRTRYWGTIYKK